MPIERVISNGVSGGDYNQGMHASDSQLQAHRGRRFWLAGCLAISIICLSYANRSLVEALNISLLHTSASDQRGWWIYSLARLLPVAALLWCIFRAPEQAGLPSIKPSSLQANGALFDPLLGLRALACFFVLMGHYFLVVFPFTLGATPRLVQALLHTSPWAGVWLFFTLSGFLMGKAFSHSRYSLDESGMRHFLRNRFLRLLPVYYVCILLIVIYRNPEVLHLHNAWIMLEMTTFDYRGDLSLNPNGALWSVSTEMQFYFLVPILMLALLRLRKEIGDLMFAVPLLLLLAGRAFRIYLTRHHVDTYYSVGYAPLLPNLDLFVTGMSLNLLPRLRAVPALLVRYRGPILLTAGVTFYAWESWITEQQRVNLRAQQKLRDLRRDAVVEYR